MTPDAEPTEDVTQKILNETELSQSDQQRKSTAETLEDERLTPQKLEKQYSRRLSELDSLEREMDSEFERVQKITDAIEEREEEEDFQRNKRKNAVDTEDYDRVRTALDRALEQFVPKLVLRDQIQFPTMEQLRSLVDRQQWAHDGERIIEQTQQIAETHRENTKTLIELQREFNKQQTEKLVDAVHTVRDQQRHAEQLLEIVTRLQELLDSEEAHQAEIAELRDQLEETQTELEASSDPAVEDTSSEPVEEPEPAAPELTSTERRMVELLQDDPALTDTELAQKVSVKKAKVAELRQNLEEQGLVDPRAD